MTTLTFRLGRPLPLWNTVMRTNPWTRSKTVRTLAREVWGAIIEVRGQRIPVEPFAHATVHIIRRSTGDPDPDGLSAKYLLDVLQPPSSRHPYGIGVLAGDTRDCLRGGAVIVHERVAKRTEECTMVTIEEAP